MELGSRCGETEMEPSDSGELGMKPGAGGGARDGAGQELRVGSL